MTIDQIKSQLPLSQVLKYYHLKPDKSLRLKCPFHDDKTPSLQVYYKTHTAYCFSTNCKTHGKSLDVIDFIMYMENCTKHEAILKAKAMIQGDQIRQKPIQDLSRSEILTKIFTYFKNGVSNSKPAKDYLESRCLDFEKTEVGYNSGQFHYKLDTSDASIKQYVKCGLLLELGTLSRFGKPAYKPFGKHCVVFAMRNAQGQIVSLYFRSILAKKNQSHFYLRDRQGLYPSYPNTSAKQLILTESIIDAATLLEQESIKDRYAVLALYGTNGLSEEHQKAIRSLKDLEEVVLFFDGDEAGRKAVEKYAPMLKGEIPHLQVSYVETPQGEDVNSLLQGHSTEVLSHLIKTRKAYDFLFSSEKKVSPRIEVIEVVPEETAPAVTPKRGLDSSNPYNLKYYGHTATYHIKGFRVNQLDSLKITLQIVAS